MASRFNLFDQGRAALDIVTGKAGSEVDVLPWVSNPFGDGTQKRAEADQFRNNQNVQTDIQRIMSGRQSGLSNVVTEPWGGQGDVLGATNQLQGGGSGGGQPSQGFLQSLMDRAGQGIQDQYSSVIGQLNQNRDFLQGQSQGLVDQAGRLYNQQLAGFDSELAGGQKDLDRSQQEVDANRKDAMSDLTSDLRSQMDSFARYLGAMGASDSSAAGMGAYAYGQMGQQARSDIWKQANKLSSDIGYRREKLNDLYRDNIRQLNDWKTNQMDTIKQDLAAKLQELNNAKMTADRDRLGQLTQLEQQIQQQAMTTALQVDQRVAQLASSNQRWAQNQAQSLAGLEQTMQQALQGLKTVPVAVDPLDSTAVNNTFNFGAGDIQTQVPGQAEGFSAILPYNRKDDDQI